MLLGNVCVTFYLIQDLLEQFEADHIKLLSGLTGEVSILAFPTVVMLANAACTFLSRISRNLQMKKVLFWFFFSEKKKSIVFHECLQRYNLAHWVS